MLFGRRTHLDLAGHWLLSTPDPNLFTDILRSTPKYVVSRTLTEPLPHPASTLLSGDAVDAVRALKADGDGELVVLGSGDWYASRGRRTGRRVPAGRSSRSSSVPVHDCSATRIPSSSRSGPRPSSAAPSSAGTGVVRQDR